MTIENGSFKTLPTIFELIVSNINSIYVIGCGGTGAYVVGFLSRILSTLGKEKNINFYIQDGDVVENKNLARQHFVASDLGKNKAEVLGERYSNAFGISIKVIPNFFDNNQLIHANDYLIIGCVDNNATRKLINNLFEKSYNCVWIDSGNEEKSGQVVCGFNKSRYYNSNWIDIKNPHKKGIRGIFSTPSVVDIYPEILDSKDKLKSELSCAERAESSPQNMMTNITAATIVLNYAQKIIFEKPLSSHAVEFSINNAFTTRLNTLENLLKSKNHR